MAIDLCGYGSLPPLSDLRVDISISTIPHNSKFVAAQLPHTLTYLLSTLSRPYLIDRCCLCLKQVSVLAGEFNSCVYKEWSILQWPSGPLSLTKRTFNFATHLRMFNQIIYGKSTIQFVLCHHSPNLGHSVSDGVSYTRCLLAEHCVQEYLERG